PDTAAGHEREAARAIGHVVEGLRRHRSDPRFGPRHDRSDAEPARLHGDPKLTRRRVPRQDRIRHPTASPFCVASNSGRYPERTSIPSTQHERNEPMRNVQRVTRPRRSCLSVPGSSPKMLSKAAGLPADEVFMDLEDSVAPGAKEE